MKERVDIMLDIETLGLTSNSQVTQISAVSFDITGEEEAYDIKVFDKYINVFDKSFQFNKVDLNTVEWWINTDLDLFVSMLEKCKNSNETEIYVLKDFAEYINSFCNEYKNVYIWSNGISFDLRIIKDKMSGYGINLPIKYNEERDVRTIIDLICCDLKITEKEYKKMFEIKDNVKHDALNDCLTQINWVVSAYRGLVYGDIQIPFEMRDNKWVE